MKAVDAVRALLTKKLSAELAVAAKEALVTNDAEVAKEALVTNDALTAFST
jgi:hypothetical protein